MHFFRISHVCSGCISFVRLTIACSTGVCSHRKASFFTDKTDDKFIQSRIQSLQEYLDGVCFALIILASFLASSYFA